MAWYDILLRMGASVFIGLIVGLEREQHHRPAGMKTHIMVCMGAAVVSIIQYRMVENTATMLAASPELAAAFKIDLGRLGAQVISGIGFLGAGTIIVRQGSVKGLTTAAMLWLTACLGLAVGMGYYFIALGGFTIVMIVLILLRILQTRLSNHNILTLEIIMSEKRGGMDNIEGFCAAHDIIIKGIEFMGSDGETGEPKFHSVYTFQIRRTHEKEALLRELLREPYIIKAFISTE